MYTSTMYFYVQNMFDGGIEKAQGSKFHRIQIPRKIKILELNWRAVGDDFTLFSQ